MKEKTYRVKLMVDVAQDFSFLIDATSKKDAKKAVEADIDAIRKHFRPVLESTHSYVVSVTRE